MSSITIKPREFRVHRSELAVPATSEHFFEKAARGEADVIFLDLEDAVPPDQKDRARKIAIAALNEIDWGSKTMAVRVNGLDTQWGYRDIIEVAEQCPRLDLILLPKAGGARDIEFVDTLLTGVELSKGRTKRLGISALIETALGMTNVEAIAQASERLESLVFGVGDYIVSMETPDTAIGGFNSDYAVLTDADSSGERRHFFNDQWHFALARIATVCRAYGLRPIDGPYTNFNDAAGFRAAALRSRALGYDGKWAIHPSQVSIANDAYTPPPELIAWAQRVSAAMKAAAEEGNGAVGLDGELLDMAHLKLAANIMKKSDATSKVDSTDMARAGESVTEREQ